MARSTIDTTMNKNQDSYPSLDGNICIYIAPECTIYFSGTSTDAATEANPSTLTKFPLINIDYTVLTNCGHPVTKKTTVLATAKYRSFTITVDAILQPPKFLQQYVALCSILTRKKLPENFELLGINY